MRRQFGAGGTPAGSSRVLRLDPLSLPVRFEARDTRADGGIRQVEINRDRVVLRRAVRGMRMAINIRVDDFLGITVRESDGEQMLVLVHRDPSMTVPLLVSEDNAELEHAARDWGAIFLLPYLDEDKQPAPRRRRHNAIKKRRPKILMRRRTGGDLVAMPVHRAEREIIART